MICSNALFTQSLDSESNESAEKNIQPFAGIGLFPQPVYISLSAGVEIGNNNKHVYGTVYAKAGNFGIENTFHSYFIEVLFKLKQFEFKNKSTLRLEVPLWLGYRNIIETFVEERHEQHDHSYLQIGTGLDIKYAISSKLDIISKLGVGYGPQYNYAGHFNFANYRFEKYSWLPLADIGIRYSL